MLGKIATSPGFRLSYGTCLGRSLRGQKRLLASLDQWVTNTDALEEQVQAVRVARDGRRRNLARFQGRNLKVAGVSFEGRQTILETVSLGDVVIFERESHNKYDANAVRISLLDGRQLGYIARTETEYFGSVPVAGRIKSVGTNPAGFLGAFVFVQPHLPCLLPPFLPEHLSKHLYPFGTWKDKELERLMTHMKRHYVFECAVTGSDSDLVPCIFWNAHPEIKQFEVASLQFLQRDLLTVMAMRSDPDDHSIDLLSAANRWTREETALYIRTATDRSSNANDWSVDISRMKKMLKELDIKMQ